MPPNRNRAQSSLGRGQSGCHSTFGSYPRIFLETGRSIWHHRRNRPKFCRSIIKTMVNGWKRRRASVSRSAPPPRRRRYLYVLEVVADPRNGVPIHIHKNEDEHFLV